VSCDLICHSAAHSSRTSFAPLRTNALGLPDPNSTAMRRGDESPAYNKPAGIRGLVHNRQPRCSIKIKHSKRLEIIATNRHLVRSQDVIIRTIDSHGQQPHMGTNNVRPNPPDSLAAFSHSNRIVPCWAAFACNDQRADPLQARCNCSWSSMACKI